MAGPPPLPPKRGPKLRGGARVTQAKAAVTPGDIRKTAAIGLTAKRRTSPFARRTAFGKGAWAQRTVRTGSGVRSAGVTRKQFAPVKARRTKAGEMFQVSQFVKKPVQASVNRRMETLLQALDEDGLAQRGKAVVRGYLMKRKLMKMKQEKLSRLGAKAMGRVPPKK